MTSPSPSGVCSRCGTAYAGGAEYCLDCGRGLPRRARFFGGLRTRNRANLALVALLLLILAALGALVAVLVSRGGNDAWWQSTMPWPHGVQEEDGVRWDVRDPDVVTDAFEIKPVRPQARVGVRRNGPPR